MAFDENEPRDDHGRWTTGGGGGGEAAPGAAGRIPAIVDPRVIPDTGDVWNRDTGTRLEKEYAEARPDLHEIVQQGIGKSSDLPADEEDKWDSLSGTAQDEAGEKYVSQNYDSAYQSEVDNWHENGEAYREAAETVSQDDDWKAETLTDFLADRKEEGLPDIPFTADDLANSIKITAADDGYYNSKKPDPEIEFDDKHLQNPHGWAGASQISPPPGIEPEKPEDKLTPEMRSDIIKYFASEFNDKVDKKADDIFEVPPYLSEQANESLTDSWAQMDDEEKYQWTKQNTDLADDLEEGTSTGPVELAEPNKWDPMNETSGEDYKRTQTMAKYLADERAVQIMGQRGIKAMWQGQPKPEAPTIADIRAVDNKLWAGWKGSSTGFEGQLLQVAAADELGGRLREAPPVKPDVESAYKEFAAGKAAQVGDLGEFGTAVKAAFNNVSDVGAFATKLSADPDMSEEQKKVAQDILYERSQTAGGPPSLKTEKIPGDYDTKILLPDLKLSRNGASSFTTDLKVANAWGGTANHAAEGIKRDDIIRQANGMFAQIGGYAGVKAAVRAKWEATQYMLDKADMPIVNLYRGISYPHKREGYSEVGEFNPPSNGKVKLDSGMEAELKDPSVGAQLHIASGKTIMKVSTEDNPNLPTSAPKGVGKWTYGYEPPRTVGRVVMRAEVPRTAVLSVPAYGVNVHSEHEVVVTGTAWKHWDAFSDTAPTAERVPIGQTTAKPEIKINLTPEQEDIVAKYKKTIPAEQQL
jgi:hypothetical protein